MKVFRLGNSVRNRRRMSIISQDLTSDCGDGEPVTTYTLAIRINGVHSTISPNDLMKKLGNNTSVHDIKLWLSSSSLWERILLAMQAPFPALTCLNIWFSAEPPSPSIIPDSSLGVSAPRLCQPSLDGASLLGPLKLVLTTPNLVELILGNVPHSGYIPPEEMVACLSSLTSLNKLYFTFQSQSRPDMESQSSQRRPLPTRAPLSTLTRLQFVGASDYLEDFLARIDAPQLHWLAIELFHKVTFDTPQLAQFIGRIPHFGALDETRVCFYKDEVYIAVSEAISLKVRCKQLDLQLAFVTHTYSSSFPQSLISTVKHLYIFYKRGQPDTIENGKWLELLLPFTTVESLYLSRGLLPCIATILNGLSEERVNEVLPVLGEISVDPSGSDQDAFGPFVDARRLSGHAIAILFVVEEE